MKVVVNQNSSNNQMDFAPIPYERAEARVVPEGHEHRYKLRTNGQDADSPVYELRVSKFSTGTPEQWLLMWESLEEIIRGQDATDGPSKYQVVERLLDGDALAVWRRSTATHGARTNANYLLCMQDITKHIFPSRAFAKQKKALRKMRKPRDTSIEDHVARLKELNSYLPKFPLAAGRNNAYDPLEDEDIVDIIECGIPNSWKAEMKRQAFNPDEHNSNELTDFLKNLEECEASGVVFGTGKPAKNQKSSNGDKKPSKKAGKNKRTHHERSRDTEDADGEDYLICMLHGKTYGKKKHDTDGCRTLQNQAKKMRATYESQHPSQKKAYQEKKAREAFVQEAVANYDAQLKKKRKLRSAGKKAKEEQFNIDSFQKADVSDDDSSVASTTRRMEQLLDETFATDDEMSA